ncbi:MAG TPA: L,D-transpeptidase family protein [Acidimicrobiales bacterium]|nr:L,D-transpeptidase family protein [Acidimicrobiales bacterium]
MRSLPRLTSHLAVAALLAGGLAGCHHAAASRAASTGTTASSTTTTTEAPTTTTTAASTTTAKPLPGLGVGAKGPAVQALEQRLTDLHYDTGKVDGTFDSTTAFAVMAFQKVTGMARTGRATDDVVAALQSATDPPAMVPAGGSMRVEVDLKRQVLFLFQGGALSRILPVSTGSGQRYCVDGECDVAVTPGGSFRVGVKILGDHVSKLGHLYNPLFFNGGIAIHGAPSVPGYPASHGCVRIPMADSLWFYNTVPRGTPVYVVGGKAAPVPFDEPAPGQAPPNPPTTAPPTTSTTSPTTTTSTSTTSTSTTSTTSTTLHP